ncbi:hypothetical protein ACB092_03G099500 [Castanea dentata]
MDHKNYTTVDKIFELLDHLQQHILSYLSINEVVQSSVLSKRWNHVWTAIPILGFDTTLYGYREYKSKKNLDMQRKLQDFYILSDVKKLSLNFVARYCFGRYQLPQSVLVAKSITMLTLCRCKLDTYRGDINLSSLKKLSLFYVITDDKRIQKLVAGCPMIEEMRFLGCNGLKSIKFSALIKAKLIEVELNDDLERVDLGASNLYAVHIRQTKHCEINLLSCNNLRMLKLSAPNITDEWCHNHFSQLPLIEYLNIYDCCMLERLKISSHRLKTLFWSSF